MFIFGAHMSIAKGFPHAAKETVEELQANALQIFLKSPRGRKEKPLADEEAKEFHRYCQENGIKFVVAHCSYLLNFAKPIDQDDPWMIESLISDLQKVYRLGGTGSVLHTGKYLKLSQEEAWKHIEENINYVLEQTKQEDNFIILETMSGQGTEVGFRFEELEGIYKQVLNKHHRIKFCLDTAHIFAAGYDISSKEAVAQTFEEFDDRLGLENLVVIHLNNSKKPLGSQVDRHDNLEKGLIAKEGLQEVVRIAGSRGIPLILETPEKEITHKEDIQVLKKWIREMEG